MLITSLEKAATAFTTAINAGDLDALLTLFAPDAVVAPTSPDGGPISTPEGRRAAFATMIERGSTMHCDVTRVLASGDVGLVTGTWTWSGRGRGGVVIEMSGHFADVLQRQADGNWLYVVNNPLGVA